MPISIFYTVYGILLKNLLNFTFNLLIHIYPISYLVWMIQFQFLTFVIISIVNYMWAVTAFDPIWGSISTCSLAIDLFTLLGLNECTGEAAEAAWRIKGGHTQLKTNVCNPGNMHHAALYAPCPDKMLAHVADSYPPKSTFILTSAWHIPTG